MLKNRCTGRYAVKKKKDTLKAEELWNLHRIHEIELRLLHITLKQDTKMVKSLRQTRSTREKSVT